MARDNVKTTKADRIHGLYAITPDGVQAQPLESIVVAALRGGAAVLQYRCKSISRAAQRQQAEPIRKMCRQYGTTFIVNDDIGLANEIDADGVHLGREDGSLQTARKILGAQKIIGVSCYSDLSLAASAIEGGADYIAFGSFFPSITKPLAMHADISVIADAKRRFAVPVVAIGGITLENAPQLIRAGADSLAVISDLFGAADVQIRAYAYKKLFDTHVR